MAFQDRGRKQTQNPALVLTEDRLRFAGSALVDNISYSGADIKIVIHKYGPAKNNANYNVTTDQITNVQGAVDDLRRQKAALQDRESTLKTATQGLDYVRRQLGNIDSQIQNYMDSILLANDSQRQEAKSSNDQDSQTLVLAEAQSISISTYREKIGVRSLGSTYPKNFTRGPRQIAGTIVFTVFDKDVLFDMLEAHPSDIEASTVSSAIIDQLPPVDIIISFANEMGAISRMAIYGVEFMSSGLILSIEDIITENTVQWVARDYDPMRTVALPVYDRGQNQLYQQFGIRASSLLREEDYQQIKANSSPFERFKRRRNPFQ